MAQPYDKTGSTGKKTLLSQEDLEKMNMEGMMFWGIIDKFSLYNKWRRYRIGSIGKLSFARCTFNSY